jgi:dipeptidyl aminopeptidase/acylaminoacyl peptidase
MLGNLLLAAAMAASPQATLGLDARSQALLRRPEYEQVVISPDGALLAVAQHEGPGTHVAVFNVGDLSLVKRIDTGGKRGEVSDLVWLGSRQLIIGTSRSVGPYSSPVSSPILTLINLYKTHGSFLPANFIGTIENDEKHVLVRSCKDDDKDGCIFEVQLVDIDHFGHDGIPIARAPVANAHFMIDHAGQVRFAWAMDKREQSRLYVRKNDKDWKLINDSSVSGVDAYPVGIARDNRSGVLQMEHRDGPDSLDRYDFATDTRTQLLRDKVSDPLSIVYTPDLAEPIGAWFGTGRPWPRFWSAQDPDAIWRMAVGRAFPESSNVITSSSKDGNLEVVFAQSDRDPGSFYLLDRANKKARLLFRSKPWIDPKQQLPTEAFTMAARDGLGLGGFLTLPVDVPLPAPMIVMVHGGPYYVRDDWSFDEETQLLAQHGYAVLRVNFRGSSGLGRPFQEKGYMQWGAAMQDDVTDATRWAIAQGLADAKRICIYGGSYGGYAALMGAVREPGLYRCAAGLAGVYDLSKQYKWGDTHRSDLGMDYLKRVIGQDPQQLASRSPSTHAAEITMPILLAHGTLDGRVDVKHAKEMRKALTRAGHPPEYLEYPYEGHGLANEEHLADFYTHLLHFFDANIGAESNHIAAKGSALSAPQPVSN